MKWRVIITDTEGPTGVAPVCDNEDTAKNHVNEYGEPLPDWVFDCCPGPHIECWQEVIASSVAAWLTETDAELCW